MDAKLLIIVVLVIPWPTCNLPRITIYPAPTQPEMAVGDVRPARIEYNGAILACDEPTYDFGTKWIGPKLSHEFEIHNDGAKAGWFRVGYAFAGTMPACVVRIEPGETLYVPGSPFGPIDSHRFKGHFEKWITLRFVPDPGDACVRCLSLYDSQQHATTCKPECFERQDTSYCIRRPFEAACEAPTPD